MKSAKLPANRAYFLGFTPLSYAAAIVAAGTSVYGDKPISDSTAADYRWRFRCHLNPYFRHLRLDEIDRDLCLAFKAHKLAEARELREAIAAGADLRDYRDRRLVPLGPA